MTPPAPITVRRLTEADIPAVEKLIDTVIPWAYAVNNLVEKDAHMAEEIHEKKHMLRLDLQSGGRDYYFLLAERQGELAGMIAHGPANTLMHMCSEGASHGKRGINNLLVAREHQGAGVAKALFFALAKDMAQQGYDEFCLDCGYIHAQPIWKSLLGEPQFIKENCWGKDIHHMGWLLPLSVLNS